MRRYLLVCEPVSTGRNYVLDAERRGYVPIALFPWIDLSIEGNRTYQEEFRDEAAATFPADTVVVYADEDYETTLERLRGLDIACVVIGSEQGAIIGDRIARDLGLPGNPVGMSTAHVNKDDMQRALARAGLRHIRGRLVRSVDEAAGFIDAEGLTKTVVKHVDGAGSVGLHICATKDDALEAVRDELGKNVMFAKTSDSMLVQEFVEGTEYIVNTVSRAGRHCITDIWRYHKVAVGSEGNPYDNATLTTRLEPAHYELCRYALAVVDALGIKYGPTHGEYMLTSTGAVLIEAGARPMGAGMSADYLDEVLGHHITDVSLDSYLEPARFEAFCDSPYRPRKSAMLKLFIAPEAMRIDSIPLLNVLGSLRSLHSVDLAGTVGSTELSKTVDLETAAGCLYLCNEDESQLMGDYRLVRLLETDFFGMLFEGDRERVELPGEDASASLAGALEAWGRSMASQGRGLVVFTNDASSERPEAVGERGEVVDISEAFSVEAGAASGPCDLILHLTSSDFSMEDLMQSLTKVIADRNVRRVVVPEAVFPLVPYGSAGIAVMLETNGFTVEVPTWEQRGLLVATLGGRSS